MKQIDNDLAALLQEQPASLEELIDKISPTIYEKLRTAVELGKWEDGSRLAPGQVDFCMQAVILFEARNLPEEQRTGAQLSDSCASKAESEIAQVLNITESGDS